MSDYRYILEPYDGPKSRHRCPSCEKPRKFSRYIDTSIAEPLADHIGRCDRINTCGYHYTPKQYFEDNPWKQEAYTPTTLRTVLTKPESKKPGLIPFGVFRKSLSAYDNNNFVKYLKGLFGTAICKELIERFYIGTSKHWNGSTALWQIDTSGKIRSGKIMLFNTDTGKRVKEPFNHIHWVHSILMKEDFNLSQCLFGEHQLKTSSMPVAICESEKTAILCSVYLQEFVWLASGGISNLTWKKFISLKGKDITLFPDLNAYVKWKQKAQEIEKETGINIKVSDILETNATPEQKEKGLDLADFLTVRDPKFGWALKDKYPLFWDFGEEDSENPPSTVDSKSSEPISTKLQRMIVKNPKVQDLIDRLELSEVA